MNCSGCVQHNNAMSSKIFKQKKVHIVNQIIQIKVLIGARLWVKHEVYVTQSQRHKQIYKKN